MASLVERFREDCKKAKARATLKPIDGSRAEDFPKSEYIDIIVAPFLDYANETPGFSFLMNQQILTSENPIIILNDRNIFTRYAGKKETPIYHVQTGMFDPAPIGGWETLADAVKVFDPSEIVVYGRDLHDFQDGRYGGGVGATYHGLKKLSVEGVKIEKTLCHLR